MGLCGCGKPAIGCEMCRSCSPSPPPNSRPIGGRVEGRVDVDEVYLAGEFGEERREDVFLVAPDEAIAPLGIASGGEEFEVAAAILGAVVDGFDGLKGERDTQRSLLLAVRVALAVPNEFGHVGGMLPR